MHAWKELRGCKIKKGALKAFFVVKSIRKIDSPTKGEPNEFRIGLLEKLKKYPMKTNILFGIDLSTS